MNQSTRMGTLERNSSSLQKLKLKTREQERGGVSSEAYLSEKSFDIKS